MDGRVVMVALLVVPLTAWPAPAQPEAGPVVLVQDDVGEAMVPPSLGESHPASVLDIESLLLVKETNDTIALALKLASLAVGDSRTVYLYDARYEVDFRLKRDEPLPYRLTVGATVQTRQAGTAPEIYASNGLWARLCVDPHGEGCAADWRGPAHVSAAERTLSVELPKLGLSESRFGASRAPLAVLGVGSIFESFTVRTYSLERNQLPPDPPWSATGADEAGPDGTYVLRSPGPSPLLHVVLGERNELAALPETNQTVRFGVVNLAPEKRVVRFSFEVDPTSPLAPLFEVHGPKAVLIGAGQTRNYTFTLKTPTLEAGTQWPNLTALAEVAGTPDYRSARVQLVPGHALSPTQNAFYFHNLRGQPQFHGLDWPCQVDVCHTLRLSHLASMPGSDPDTRAVINTEEPGGSSNSWLLPPLRMARPAFLDTKARLEFRMTMGGEQADIEGAKITLQASYFHNFRFVPIAAAYAEETLPKEGKSLVLTGKVQKLPLGHVPADATFALSIRVEVEPILPTCCIDPRQAWIEPIESRVVLPVQDIPDYALAAPNPSPFQVALLDEREDFVNPGESRLANFTITNIDAVEQRLHLRANASAPGYEVTILPGTEFLLSSGDSVRVGVQVRAPADAPEGEGATVWLVAFADDGSERVDRFGVVATTFDVVDEADAFRADDEDNAKIVGTAVRPTPGIGWAWALAAAGAAWAARRRRQ